PGPGGAPRRPGMGGCRGAARLEGLPGQPRAGAGPDRPGPMAPATVPWPAAPGLAGAARWVRRCHQLRRARRTPARRAPRHTIEACDAVERTADLRRRGDPVEHGTVAALGCRSGYTRVERL